MEPLPPWDQLTRGVGCPLCEEHRQEGLRWFVRRLRLSSLYLTREQTYRGSCALIADRRHVNHVSELTAQEWGLMAQDLRDAEGAILKVFSPDHINIECLGNTVAHLHWGLLPRYKGDGRWGQPVWKTNRSDMKQTLLSDDDYATCTHGLQKALEAVILQR